MRILLDECVPRPLRRELPDHEIRTVVEMGWSDKRNSELLSLLIASGFELLLTTDQSFRYQQNLSGLQIALIVLTPCTNRLVDILPLMPKVHEVLETVRPGDVVEVGWLAR